MSKWIVTYEDKYGDLSHVRVNADNITDAEMEVRSEYWNVDTIVDIYESLVSTDRPYKKPMPNDRALSILKEMVNEGKLDSKLVDYFVEFKGE